MTQKRIGFACKLSENDPKKGVISIPGYNTKTTTISWLNRQPAIESCNRLFELARHNVSTLRAMIEEVSTWEASLRMVRISSDLLPAYTEKSWGWFWTEKDVVSFLEKELSEIGKLARQADIKLSFHPGQFCCIVSDRPEVVKSSICELEYHADIARWMGYGVSKLDFKINVHLSGRQGPDGFKAAWNKFSPELRSCLTLENDEYQAGLDDILPLRKYVGIVLDIHHYLIKEHVYIGAHDDRIKQIIDSWQGMRPTLHYSQSHEDYIHSLSHNIPSMDEMLQLTTKSRLRAHSNFYPNEHINKWALSHLKWGDIMAECKSKNLGAKQLHLQAKQLGLL